ncbi:hypothetical protein BT69DRAFT_1337321 [Atractiella rhizophila]|nr:hypothetical protein BT69DRAFT_1337321 [Atractiella rhizophila]
MPPRHSTRSTPDPHFNATHSDLYYIQGYQGEQALSSSVGTSTKRHLQQNHDTVGSIELNAHDLDLESPAAPLLVPSTSASGSNLSLASTTPSSSWCTSSNAESPSIHGSQIGTVDNEVEVDYDYTEERKASTATARPLKKPKSSHARKVPPNHIKRPKNAFILYRSWFCSQEGMSKAHGVHDHRDISRIVGQMWKQLPASEKRRFEEMAEEEKAEHKRLYPDYKYKPVYKKTLADQGRKRKNKRGAEEDYEINRRCMEIANIISEESVGNDPESSNRVRERVKREVGEFPLPERFDKPGDMVHNFADPTYFTPQTASMSGMDDIPVSAVDYENMEQSVTSVEQPTARAKRSRQAKTWNVDSVVAQDYRFPTAPMEPTDPTAYQYPTPTPDYSLANGWYPGTSADMTSLLQATAQNFAAVTSIPPTATTESVAQTLQAYSIVGHPNWNELQLPMSTSHLSSVIPPCATIPPYESYLSAPHQPQAQYPGLKELPLVGPAEGDNNLMLLDNDWANRRESVVEWNRVVHMNLAQDGGSVFGIVPRPREDSYVRQERAMDEFLNYESVASPSSRQSFAVPDFSQFPTQQLVVNGESKTYVYLDMKQAQNPSLVEQIMASGMGVAYENDDPERRNVA